MTNTNSECLHNPRM